MLGVWLSALLAGEWSREMEPTTERTMAVKTILKLLDAQIGKATTEFYTARGREDAHKAEIYAEVKWSLAELKLNIADELVS